MKHFFIVKHLRTFVPTVPATLPVRLAHHGRSYFFTGMQYVKSALSIPQQIELLISRGLIIQDTSKVEHYLSNISYYRLSAYFHAYQTYENPNHIFFPDTTFEKIIDLYRFDRRLRLLIFNEIEKIEIAFRTQIIYEYSIFYSGSWLEDKQLYRANEYQTKFLSLINIEIRKSNEIFIKHYTKKYTHPSTPPAWIALEVASFGQLSTLYKNLKTEHAKKNVATHFSLHYTVLESWLESLALVRNICAHHSRLWNRKLPKSPLIPNEKNQDWVSIPVLEGRENRIYYILSTINYLLRNVTPQNGFAESIKSLDTHFPSVPFQSMGFPKNWKSDPFWN